MTSLYSPIENEESELSIRINFEQLNPKQYDFLICALNNKTKIDEYMEVINDIIRHKVGIAVKEHVFFEDHYL